ncbi:monooxygenase [Seiridium cupressi]
MHSPSPLPLIRSLYETCCSARRTFQIETLKLWVSWDIGGKKTPALECGPHQLCGARKRLRSKLVAHLEGASEWIVTLETKGDPNQKTIVKCDIFVSATGRLNNWKLPDIKGIDGFSGSILHSANWSEDFQYAGKDVAIIGNGASAVQCLAAMGKDAKSIGNFVRGPTWLVPHVFSKNGEPQVIYDEELSHKFQDDPVAYYDFRLQIERQLAGSFEGLWAHSDAAKRFTSSAANHMRNKIVDSTTLGALMPTAYKAGCRRFTPADRYMDALNQSHVQLIPQPIERIDSSMIYTSDGKSRRYDAIICGTGFEPYAPRFPVTGRGGILLSDVWSDEGGYQSYLAATVAEFPNFFGKSE